MKQGTKNHAGDRISALPEPLIHHIFSFLLPTIKDLKVISSLSKTWLRFCSSYPYLDFHGSPFDRNWDKHLHFIDKTLQIFHNNALDLQIQRLMIPITILPGPRVANQINYLNNWIKLVLQHGVHEFKLQIDNPLDVYKHWYDLPQEIFAAKEIKVTMLEGISLLNSFPYKHISGSSSSCNLMRKLFIDKALLDDRTLPCIISTCPLIEDLSLSNCFGIKCIGVSNLDKLKTLQISRLLEEKETIIVKIDAPSLKSLEIEGPLEIRVLESPNLTNLALDHVVLEELRLNDVLLRLSFLHSLSLSNLSSSTKVKVSSHALNKLVIFGCCNLIELDTNALNLLNCEFHPLASTSTLFKATGNGVDGTGYCIFVNPYTVKEFFVELRKFISERVHFEYLSLYIQEFHVQPFNFEELKNRVIDQHPIAIIDDLELCIKNISRISFLDLFESVLWICHPRTLTLQLDHNGLVNVNKIFVEDICKIIMSHRPARRWLHCLEEVRCASEDGTQGRLPMDGIFVPHLCSSYEEIKFIFKW